MKKSLVACFSFILFMGIQEAQASEILYRNIGGYKATLLKIVPNQWDSIVVAASNTEKSLKELVAEKGGYAGINGAYFCPKDYPWCGGKSYTETLRISGWDAKSYSKYYPDTGINWLFWLTASGGVILLKNSIWSGDSSTNFNTGSLSQVEEWIANFPILLYHWENMLWLYRHWEITNKMKHKSIQNFICSRQDGSILMGSVNNIWIMEMPSLLKQYSCYDALNLDSGGSTALYKDGKYLAGPGRKIMDAFVVVKTKK